MLDGGLGSEIQCRGGAAQRKPEDSAASEAIGQQSPAPRLNYPNQPGSHHREEDIG